MKTIVKPEIQILEREIIFDQTFDAPKEKLFAAWTDPKQFVKWWGPNGFTIPFCELNVQKGGTYRVVMHGNGHEYPMKGFFLDVIKNEKLTFTVNVEEHPKEWKRLFHEFLGYKLNDASLETVIDASFKEEGGRTRLAVTVRFGSDSVLNAYVKTGMKEGWTESLERLDELLSE